MQTNQKFYREIHKLWVPYLRIGPYAKFKKHLGKRNGRMLHHGIWNWTYTWREHCQRRILNIKCQAMVHNATVIKVNDLPQVKDIINIYGLDWTIWSHYSLLCPGSVPEVECKTLACDMLALCHNAADNGTVVCCAVSWYKDETFFARLPIMMMMIIMWNILMTICQISSFGMTLKSNTSLLWRKRSGFIEYTVLKMTTSPNDFSIEIPLG